MQHKTNSVYVEGLNNMRGKVVPNQDDRAARDRVVEAANKFNVCQKMIMSLGRSMGHPAMAKVLRAIPGMTPEKAAAEMAKYDYKKRLRSGNAGGQSELEYIAETLLSLGLKTE